MKKAIKVLNSPNVLVINAPHTVILELKTHASFNMETKEGCYGYLSDCKHSLTEPMDAFGSKVENGRWTAELFLLRNP